MCGMHTDERLAGWCARGRGRMHKECAAMLRRLPFRGSPPGWPGQCAHAIMPQPLWDTHLFYANKQPGNQAQPGAGTCVRNQCAH